MICSVGQAAQSSGTTGISMTADTACSTVAAPSPSIPRNARRLNIGSTVAGSIRQCFPPYLFVRDLGLGLGLAACQKGMSVGFTTAAAFVHELIEARDEKPLLRLQRQLAGHKLLIVDYLGKVPLSQTGGTGSKDPQR
jgi:hypothetical protein